MSSTYPGGFLNGLVVRGVPITQLHPGEVFWVNNSSVLAKGGIGGSDGNKGSYREPFKTIDYAVGKCTAARGDIIAVMPGHAEEYTIATATSDELTLDVEGVAIVGLGSGSLRPTITQSTSATTNIKVTAANCMIYNVWFKSTVQDLAISILLTTAKHFSLIKCTFEDTSNALNYKNIVESTGAASTVDGLHVEDCEYLGLDPSFNSFCVIAAAQDNMKFIGNKAWTTAIGTEPVLLDLTGDSTHLWMTKNMTNTLATTNVNQLVKASGTACTGWLYDNLCTSLDSTGVSYTVASKLRVGVMYHGGVVTTQAALIDPALDT